MSEQQTGLPMADWAFGTGCSLMAEVQEAVPAADGSAAHQTEASGTAERGPYRKSCRCLVALGQLLSSAAEPLALRLHLELYGRTGDSFQKW